MNSSELMDKQIMDLSKSQTNINTDQVIIKDINNNNNNPPNNEEEDEIIGENNRKNEDDDDDEIVPSYDFHPIRPLPHHHSGSEVPAGSRIRPLPHHHSVSDASGGSRNYSSIYPNEPAKSFPEKDHITDNSALLSEIERTMKSHADNIMHALEGVSARISQLESRSRNLENSVDDLKIAMGNNQGSSDGKMRQLENIMREVQSGVQFIRDKQDLLESQVHLPKLQVPKAEHQTEPQSLVHSNSYQQIASAPLQSHHPQPPPSLPRAPQQNLPNQYLPNQIPPPPQRDPYYPPLSQPQDTTTQQYPPSTPQYPQPPAPPQYSQPPPSQQHPSLSSMNLPHFPLPHHPEDSPYPPPPQSYPPNIRQPSPQQYYNSPSNMYEPPSPRPNSGYSPNYGPSSSPTEPPPYPYGGPPSQYGAKQQPQLPTARVLPSGGSSGAGAGNNRVPIDDVVDKVSNMGFSREQARATVRKLMENGQAVDLNMVLDKLMNEGAESQPSKGFYGR